MLFDNNEILTLHKMHVVLLYNLVHLECPLSEYEDDSQIRLHPKVRKVLWENKKVRKLLVKNVQKLFCRCSKSSDNFST